MTVFQANYDSLVTITRSLEQHAAKIEQMRRTVTRQADQLRQSWEGEAALAFFGELEAEVLPATMRLQEALTEAARVTGQISEIIRDAEEEAAALFAGGMLGGNGSAWGDAESAPPLSNDPPSAGYTDLARREQLRELLATSGVPQFVRDEWQRELDEVEARLAEKAEEAHRLLDQLRLLQMLPDSWAAATIPSLREQIYNDPDVLEGLAATMDTESYLNLLVELQTLHSGTTPHTSAQEADRLIRTTLPDYLDGAIADDRQITGRVAVVDGANFDAAGYAAYGDDWPTRGPSINAFVDSSGRVWVNSDRGNAGTVIHEAMHKYSDDAVRTTVSWDLNEGMTEYFSRQVIAGLPDGANVNTDRSKTIYRYQHQIVDELVTLVGEDVVASAYFDGDTASLRDSFLADTRRPDTDWDDFIDHLDDGRWSDARALLTPLPPPTPPPRNIPR